MHVCMCVCDVYVCICSYVRVLVFACVLSLSLCVCVCFLRLLKCDSWHHIKNHGLREVWLLGATLKITVRSISNIRSRVCSRAQTKMPYTVMMYRMVYTI